MPQEATLLAAPRRRVTKYEPIRPTPLGRAIVGTLLALGLYLGLRKLATGWVLATEPDPEAWWLSFDGLRAVFAFQAAAVLFGGVLAGAGRPRGFLLGAVIGGLCGGLLLAAEVYSGASPLDMVILVQPLVLLVAGGIGGVAGSRLWPIPPDVEMPPPATTQSKLSSLKLGVDEPDARGRPTAWARILIGAAIMVAGVGLAEPARFGAQKYSGGLLQVASRGQGKYLSWQLATLAILGGAVVAGAGTGAGIRHGLFAGVLGGAGVIGLGGALGEIIPPVEYWLERVGFAGAGPLHPATITAVVGGSAVIGVVGGWLGGVLLLPLAPLHMRSPRFRFGAD
jgi:hypothetical protein